MAKIYVTKDSASLFIVGLLESGEKSEFDWSLSKSYTTIVGAGTGSFATSVSDETIRPALGLYRVAPSEKLKITAIAGSRCTFICPFLLNDDVVMNELFPTTSTLTSLRASASKLISLSETPLNYRSGLLSYDSGNIIFTLGDLNTAVLGGLSL